jgi:hypothetical protein
MPLGDHVFGPRGFAALAAHEAVEGSEIGAVAALGEEGSGVHDCQLFGYGGGDELIDADAVGFGAALDFGFHRARETKQISGLLIFVI